MSGLWQGGKYVLQSTIEDRHAYLSSEIARLNAALRELAAERDALRVEVERLKWENDRAFWVRPDGEHTSIPPEYPAALQENDHE